MAPPLPRAAGEAGEIGGFDLVKHFGSYTCVAAPRGPNSRAGDLGEDVRRMKCQKCDRPATFHITELTGGKPKELHLCEEHARNYLEEHETTEEEAAPTDSLSKQLAVGQTVEQLAKLDKQACPICGITFFDFRSKGRLGCSHDYVCFEKELEPLLTNIHGDTTHTGKRPRRSSGNTDRLTELIRLRKELKTAVCGEKYEEASKIRDEIKRLESGKA